MPRRRSGLNDRAARAALVPVGCALIALTGCPAADLDNGCQIRRQLVMPGDSLVALLPEVQIERLGSGYLLLGTDGTTVRWVTIDAAGTFGAEQAFSLPDGTLRAYYALAGVDSPGDRVIIGVLTAAANGADAELRLVAAPLDGTPAGSPGAAITTLGGGANPQVPPLVAMGTSATGMYAGVAWVDSSQSGYPTYAFIDGQGEVVGAPEIIENTPASGYSCLAFDHGKQELTISYQRGSSVPLGPPLWVIADLGVGGFVNTLTLSVTQPGGVMGCARSALYDPMDGQAPEYAIVWQDPSGSWLTVYSGPQTNMVHSYPFASSTDFGGPALQPPILGLAAFGNDFGVLFARPGSAELWRVSRGGGLWSGALLFPSLSGRISTVSSVSSTGLLTSTYADLDSTGGGRRLVVDAVCY